MSRADRWQHLSRGIVDFFFPRKCPFCGGLVGSDGECPACSKTLRRCDQVLQGSGYGRVTAPLWYEGAVRAALLAYKFEGKLGGLETFGALMAERAADAYSGEFDTVTWVPVSKKRLRKRGYDQSRYLAASLCVGWHVAPQEMLHKTKDNPAQSGLGDREERRANVLGVYQPTDPALIEGKRILLVDDIFTTGATLSECARVLREAGAADVMCLTLAITPKNAE